MKKGWVFPSFLFLSIPAFSHQFADPECKKELGEDGWRCQDNDCISMYWVCDGFHQCTDDSDEGMDAGQGCNLYPDSKCRSFHGFEHFYCERTGDCFSKREDSVVCNSSIGPANRGCEKRNEWKCKDGRCIDKTKVCDRFEHCDDGSDENDAGCFPDLDQADHSQLCDSQHCSPNSKQCHNFRGVLHERCPFPELSHLCTTSYLATLAQDYDNSSLCLQCEDDLHWRCNDGWCILKNLTNNGLPDCRDGSDESSLPYAWWVVLVTTIIIVSLGLLLSFSCRQMGVKNCRNCFHCSFCSSDRTAEYSVCMELKPSAPPLKSAGDTTSIDGPERIEEDDDDDDENKLDPECENLVMEQDLPVDLIRLIEDKNRCWDYKTRDPCMAQILGCSYSPTTVKSEYMLEVKKQYIYAHTDPLHIHHLYSFLVNRYPSISELAKITNILMDLEREIHCMSKLEVLKCWRLTLGSSEVIGRVIESVSDEPSVCSKLYNSFLPFRNCLRNIRRTMFRAKPNRDAGWFRTLKTIYFTVTPFIGASFLYFETIKNIVYVNIVYNALYDLSDGNPGDFPFEMFLLLFMIAAIVTVQCLNIVYSVLYSNDIFEISHADECGKMNTRILFKVVAFLLSPLMPCFVLANKAYYDAKLDNQRRHLQTFSIFKDPQEKEGEAVPLKETDINKKNKDELKEKIKIYGIIRQLESKSLLYRKIYSYYRVTSGVIESVTFVVVLVLLMFVTGRKGRDINLIVGVEHRLRTFFGVTSYQGGILEELNLVRDFVMGSSLMYSFFMVVSALVRYWFQAKNLCLSVGGRIVLTAYLSALTFNRLTTYISIFSITQPLKFDNGHEKPLINLPWAVVIFSILILVHLGLVYLYKKKNSLDWQDGNYLDHWINILVNSIVVLPFMVQVDQLKVLKEAEKKFNFSPDTKLEKKASMKRRQSLVKLSSLVENMREQPQNRPFIDLLLPDMNMFAAPFLYDDIRQEIKDQWWANPRQNLDTKTIRENIRDQGLKRRLDTLQPSFVEENIKVTLNQLEVGGFINVPLLNPAPTKKEYFWLWTLIILENIVALIIEVVNGGVWTSQGHYYSWDIRLTSLGLAFLFLLMYYKRYHILRDLMNGSVWGTWLHYLPICCCCSNETPMQAPANEDAIDRVLNSGQGDFRSEETQTDQIRTAQTDTQTEPDRQPNMVQHVCTTCQRIDLLPVPVQTENSQTPGAIFPKTETK